jgi:CBS domain-containing protein
MKRDLSTVGPETPTIEALRLMRRLRVGCLPVVQDERLIGIVTEEDFMEIASKMLEQQLAADEPPPEAVAKTAVKAPEPAAPAADKPRQPA